MKDIYKELNKEIIELNKERRRVFDLKMKILQMQRKNFIEKKIIPKIEEFYDKATTADVFIFKEELKEFLLK